MLLSEIYDVFCGDAPTIYEDELNKFTEEFKLEVAGYINQTCWWNEYARTKLKYKFAKRVEYYKKSPLYRASSLFEKWSSAYTLFLKLLEEE